MIPPATSPTSGRGFAESLAYVDRGSGPEVLLLHGHTGSSRNWAFVVKGLNDAGFRTIAYDHLGHGDSPTSGDLDDYSIDGLAEDCLDFCEVRGLTNPLLVGHSLGGMVAQVAALSEPSRFAGVAFVGTSARSLHGLVASQMEKAIDIVEARGLEFLFDLQMRPERIDAATQARIKASPGLADLLKGEFLRNTREGYVGCGRALLDRRDLRDDLRSLDLEALVAVGADDIVFRPECEAIAESLPRSTYVLIDGAAHSPNIDAPGALVDAIESLAETAGITR